MDGPSYKAFARAAFTGYKYAGMDGSDLADYFVDLLHGLAVAEQTFDTARSQKFIGCSQVPRQREAPVSTIESKFQGVNIERLWQEVHCAPLQGFHGRFAAHVPTVSDHSGQLDLLRRFPQQGKRRVAD